MTDHGGAASPRTAEHRAEPTHGPIGQAHLFDRCATCAHVITRIGPDGKVGKWRHQR